MKCPHCLVGIRDSVDGTEDLGTDADGNWGVITRLCPECNRMIVHLSHNRWVQTGSARMAPGMVSARGKVLDGDTTYRLVRPKAPNRSPVPAAVPTELADDYKEAALVLPDSPKASAALSRRCLQHMLTKQGFTQRELAKQIQAALDSRMLPTLIADSLDSVRNVGNFAAHPTKSTSTGEIVEVEPHEAGWNLDVIEALFDLWYVQPEALKAKQAAMNKKLVDAGKPPMKQSNGGVANTGGGLPT